MIVNEYRGGGRTARTARPKARGGWLYRLYMSWFAAAFRRI